MNGAAPLPFSESGEDSIVFVAEGDAKRCNGQLC